ncbi:Alpha-aminoadipic semialdehyde synthase, mitochondrial [Frankliniella fusca]|uniref:Alpha-aminoadipic semialdehyde synthase, mitochondrial n=1 Tax=Frankliniella fusca TaxID=407009 RepID=A0AAE1LRT7_9NEOP|nr:Alpha-aminoadipic semialdehyde synthase, mitochondrial [Frankliniella fusca]KAK3929748.1 Alpha-aminoadipic semialdehyde synthase, mitochondrial [Frankliniella fusca]
MGVSVEIWRARIGKFSSRCKMKSTSKTNLNVCAAVSCTLLLLVVAAAVTISMLLIGGIEPNPGPYPCNLCSVIPETVASSMRHQHMHASRIKAFVYRCPEQGCEKFATPSFSYLKYHVSVLHRDTYHQDPSATEMICCPYTSLASEDLGQCNYSTVSFWEFVQHLYLHLDKNHSVMCPIDDCEREKAFQKKTTFRVHMSVEHKDWRAEGCPKEEYTRDVVVPSHPTMEPFETECPPINETIQADGCDEDNELMNDDIVLDSIAKFYLHLYAENLLPQTTIQEICDSLVYLTEVIQARIKLVLSRELKELSIPQESVNLVCFKVMMADVLYTSHHRSVTGPSLTSDHLRRKYFTENFGYREPVQINLSENDPDSTDTLQYLSVEESLSQLLQDDTIQQEIEASFFRIPSPENEVHDYYDGTLFKSEDHSPREIHLNIYQDSFNIVMNPLGSAKNKFKDLVVYFTINNFKPHLRSKIATKNLILICRETVFKKVGAKKCLERMVEELKKLEAEGIMFKNEKVDVVVEFMLGDNLGQHLIGGFIESFSCTYACRFCEIKRNEYKSNPCLAKPQRTKENYDRCVLRANLTGKIVRGVKADCELNTLKHFHATSHLVCCLAHDLFEGCVSWDLAGIISHFVHDKKWFTYELLNKRIKSFKCIGIDSRNKPAPVHKMGEKLGGHAVQNWMLLRLLFFIIGDKIQDFYDPAWKLYIQLKELCEYVCAPVFLKSDVPYLKDVLIPAYFENRREVLCEKKHPIKPKHHYFLAHYPELMLKYGPLIHLWTLPYEQKHSFFKELMRKTRNFINPEHTCAVRYQMSFCYSATSEMFCEHFIDKKSRPLTSSNFTGDLSAYISRQKFDHWFESETVFLGSSVYKKGDLLLLALNGSVISVGIIKVIASKESLLKFIIEQRKAYYDSDLGIYEVDLDSLGAHSTHELSTLDYPVPQPLYTWGGKSLFSLKYKLVQSSDGCEDSS